jgi:hypothetical protein
MDSEKEEGTETGTGAGLQPGEGMGMTTLNDTIESLQAENAELKARWEKLKDFLRIDGNDWGTLETVLNYMQEIESGGEVPFLGAKRDKASTREIIGTKEPRTPKPDKKEGK